MAIDLNSMSDSTLRSLAAQNSTDWFNADKATQNALHAQNVEINRILDERTGSTSAYDAPSGVWTVTEGTKSAAQTPSLIDEYRSVIAAQSAALAEQRSAQEAAVRKAVNALEGQRETTEAQYGDLFRQLYLDKMNSQKNMDQRLAARGVTGGAAETTRLGYDTAYEDALRQGEQGRISALNSIDRAITDARLSGDVASAEAAARAAQEQTSAYADALKYLINRQDAIDARQESYAREDAQRAAAYAREQERQRREDEEKEEKAKKPTLTVAQVNAALKAGYRTDAVLAAYEYYYGQPYKG